MDKPIVIALTIIVFFAGFGVGSVVFYNQPSTPMLGQGMMGSMSSPETMNQMMQDPEFRNEMMDYMVQDSEHMRQWMLEDPDHIPLMIEEMKTNHDFMMGMAMPMIQDPEIRLQMMGHMTENPEAMAEMQQMMSDGMMGQEMMGGGHMIGSGMMDQGMMSSQSSQTIPAGEEPQTRTFQISMEEVEFYAEAENEEGEEVSGKDHPKGASPID